MLRTKNVRRLKLSIKCQFHVHPFFEYLQADMYEIASTHKLVLNFFTILNKIDIYWMKNTLEQ